MGQGRVRVLSRNFLLVATLIRWGLLRREVRRRHCPFLWLLLRRAVRRVHPIQRMHRLLLRPHAQMHLRLEVRLPGRHIFGRRSLYFSILANSTLLRMGVHCDGLLMVHGRVRRRHERLHCLRLTLPLSRGVCGKGRHRRMVPSRHLQHLFQTRADRTRRRQCRHLRTRLLLCLRLREVGANVLRQTAAERIMLGGVQALVHLALCYMVGSDPVEFASRSDAGVERRRRGDGWRIATVRSAAQGSSRAARALAAQRYTCHWRRRRQG